ncbi:MAG: cytochrome C [Gammaproteobacteria bacterium]|nr:cytochrome C [Gammaproteobacteria bacterium]|tara:strand:- start:465 stop:830 length:366 start_codon:yes stop_codon:yes gene_type:complete
MGTTNLKLSESILLIICCCLPEIQSKAAESSGERLFLDNCAECHQADGLGIPNIYPPLAGNELVLGNGLDVALVLIIGRGEMPSFDGAISSDDMASIINYVRNSFGNKGELISASKIESLK